MENNNNKTEKKYENNSNSQTNSQTNQQNVNSQNTKFKVGFTYDKKMLLHKNSNYSHPECPERISSIYDNVNNKGLIIKAIPSQLIIQ